MVLRGIYYICVDKVYAMGIEQPSKYYDAIYRRSREYKGHYSDVRWLPMFERAMQFLVRGSILELGCGVGQFAHMLYDMGMERYTGIDFSQEAIRQCKSKSLKGYDFICDSIYNCIEMDCYDNIVAFEVFEHLDDLQVLSMIPKGKNLIISLPTFGGKAHLRYFETKGEIERYYEGVIGIGGIERVINWHLIVGEKL